MEHFIDAHCHYDPRTFSQYNGECGFICNAVREDDWARLISIAAADVRIRPAIGIHPWYVMPLVPGWTERMRRMLRENPNLMVGEIGIDRCRSNLDKQTAVFRAQYKIASEFQRSVHIHCVHAWERLQRVLNNVPLPPVIVIHRYTASQELMQILRRATQDRIYFSFRDVAGERMGKLLMAVPASRILVETDGWAPEPDKIKELVMQIAIIRGRTMSDMMEIIYNNTLRVISNGQIEENQNVTG